MKETRAALVGSQVLLDKRELEYEGMQGRMWGKRGGSQVRLGIVGADGRTFEDRTGRRGRSTGGVYGGSGRWTMASSALCLLLSLSSSPWLKSRGMSWRLCKEKSGRVGGSTYGMKASESVEPDNRAAPLPP